MKDRPVRTEDIPFKLGIRVRAAAADAVLDTVATDWAALLERIDAIESRLAELEASP